MRRILASCLPDDDKKYANAVWALIVKNVDATVKKNLGVHRLELALMRQKSNENLTSNVLKFAVDPKVFRKVNIDSDKQHLQNDPDRLVKWTEK